MITFRQNSDMLTCPFLAARGLARTWIVVLCLAANTTLSSMTTNAVDAVVLDGEPSLDLSDIIHTVSPTPSPLLDIEQQRADAVSPEPLTELEISQIRRRVIEMGLSFSGKGKANANTRERELADMVNALATPGVGDILICCLRF